MSELGANYLEKYKSKKSPPGLWKQGLEDNGAE